MKMTYSSIATIFVPTEPKSQRRQFLQRQDPESGQGFEIEDKKGRFLEKPDLVSKYERRKLLPRREEEEETPEAKEDAETLEQMTFCQFIKMYEGKGWQDMRKTNEEGETGKACHYRGVLGGPDPAIPPFFTPKSRIPLISRHPAKKIVYPAFQYAFIIPIYIMKEMCR